MHIYPSRLDLLPVILTVDWTLGLTEWRVTGRMVMSRTTCRCR